MRRVDHKRIRRKTTGGVDITGGRGAVRQVRQHVRLSGGESLRRAELLGCLIDLVPQYKIDAVLQSGIRIVRCLLYCLGEEVACEIELAQRRRRTSELQPEVGRFSCDDLDLTERGDCTGFIAAASSRGILSPCASAASMSGMANSGLPSTRYC
jgi:hypothetical protein